MASVRVWLRKSWNVAPLTFDQRQVLKLGTVAVAEVKNRVQAAKNLADAPAKPLSVRYAITKSRNLARGGLRRTGRGSGRKNVRDLTYTGNMLRNFQVRTVSNWRAVARNTTRLDRIKALANQRREQWVGYSPQNVRKVTTAGNKIFQETIPRLLVQKAPGGRQI